MHQPFVWDECMDALAKTAQALERLAELIPEERWEVRPSPDRYSPKELVHHLLDVEEAFFRRYQQIAEEDHPTLSVYDPETAPIDEQFSTGRLHDALKEFAEARQRSLDYLQQLPPEARDRTGIHPEFGEWSIFQQVHLWVAHDLLHLCDVILRTR